MNSVSDTLTKQTGQLYDKKDGSDPQTYRKEVITQQPTGQPGQILDGAHPGA